MNNTEKEQIGTAKPIAEQSNQSNISEHSKNQFEEMIFKGLSEGGIQFTASKGHGKTRFLFSVAENLMLNDSVRTIIFEGSTAWLYGFNQIEVFTIREHDIIAQSRKTTEDLEKYSLENWNLVKLALDTRKDHTL